MRVSSGTGSVKMAGGGRTSTHGVVRPRSCQAGASARGAEVISAARDGKEGVEGWRVDEAMTRERGFPRPRRELSRRTTSVSRLAPQSWRRTWGSSTKGRELPGPGTL